MYLLRIINSISNIIIVVLSNRVIISFIRPQFIIFAGLE